MTQEGRTLPALTIQTFLVNIILMDWRLNSCLRCGGDLYSELDDYRDEVYHCLQCSNMERKLAEVQVVDEATPEEVVGIKKILEQAGLIVVAKGRELVVLAKDRDG